MLGARCRWCGPDPRFVTYPPVTTEQPPLWSASASSSTFQNPQQIKRESDGLTTHELQQHKRQGVLLQVYGPLKVARATPLARWADRPYDPIPLAHMIPPAFTHAATFV